MDKQGAIALQNIDCNCNNCKHMVRDFEKFKSFDWLYEGRQNCGHRINYGTCHKFGKPVSFIPGYNQIETQHCFENRKQLSP